MNNTQSQMFAAIPSGDVVTIERLLQYGASPNMKDADGESILGRACEKGQMKIVELLLVSGADIDIRGGGGATPMMIAAAAGHISIVELLLSHKPGADPHAKGDGNINALIASAGMGHALVVKLLLDYRVDPNYDSFLGTALVAAATFGHSNAAEVLIKSGALIDKPTEVKELVGASPLMIASGRGHIDCVKLLLSHGADPLYSDNGGLTAWDFAKQNKHTEIMQLLAPYQDDAWSALGKIVAKGVHGVRRVADGFAGELARSSEQANLNKTDSEKVEADPQALSLHLDDLNKLVGLSSVKADVAKHISLIRVQQMRREKGLSVPEQSLHMVFSGNPGTGKTSVARLIAKIYKQMGILSKGQFVETDRGGLVAEYLGQTAPKVQAVVKKALGGVLFIDEAYTLNGSGRSDDQYGKEAIETLLKLMEDHRKDLIVIVAGYTEPMERFIRSNPGLQSRFNKYIHFEDYSASELTEIFLGLAGQNDYKVTAEAQSRLHAFFAHAYQSRNHAFGNARLARNLFESSMSNHAMRLGVSSTVSEDDLITFKAEDISL